MKSLLDVSVPGIIKAKPLKKICLRHYWKTFSSDKKTIEYNKFELYIGIIICI